MYHSKKHGSAEHRGNIHRAKRPRPGTRIPFSSTDNKPASERSPGRDNLNMAMTNPRTVLSGFKFVGNNRGPVKDYGTRGRIPG